MKKTSLKDALSAWVARPADETDKHIPPAALYEFLIHPVEQPPAFLRHLGHCAQCAQELQEMVQSLEQAEERLKGWDLACPKAAASTGSSARKIVSEAGKYTIEIRPHTVESDRGIIILQVSPQYRQALEGRRVSLRDGLGRTLLEGRILGGEAAQEMEGLDQIGTDFIIRAD